MAKEKFRVIVLKRGVPVGYIKSVSYIKGTFTTVTSKMDAKTYGTADRVQGEIDFLASKSFGTGLTFMYD